jgi:hypothetical protein
MKKILLVSVIVTLISLAFAYKAYEVYSATKEAEIFIKVMNKAFPARSP